MRWLLICVAAATLAGCQRHGAGDQATQVVERIGDCAIYRIYAPETYSGYVWTTICPAGQAQTATTDGHGGKGSHYEDVVVDTRRPLP